MAAELDRLAATRETGAQRVAEREAGMEITATDIDDPDAIADQWRTLEDRSLGLFYQGWTWMGCLARERFASPLLVSARRAGVVVGLALFSRRDGRLFLAESGEPGMDSIYGEYAGALLDRDQSPALAGQMMRAAVAHVGGRTRLTAHRMEAEQYWGMHGWGAGVTVRRPAASWTIDFNRMRRIGVDPIASFGSNTRAAIRRSLQAYARDGGVSITRATTVAEAHRFLDDLIALHQAFRVARGQPGAFAEPFMTRFHRALIARGLPRDEIDLLRIATRRATLGVVYNFRHRGRVYSYQSGFAVEQAGKREKPGLTSYALCAERYLAAGVDAYDFLVGDAPYKRNIANTYAVMY